MSHASSNAASGDPGIESSDSWRLRLVLAAVALSLFSLYLDFFALNLALPTIARELRTSVTDLQWVVSGYMLAAGALFIVGGRLGDIFGRRRLLLTGVALFGLASLLCGLAPSAGALVGLRILQGVGAAIIFPNAVACLTNSYPPQRSGKAIGLAFGFGALGTALGPFVGGALAGSVGWRWVFWLNIPFALAAIVLIMVAISESRDLTVPPRIDFPGLLTLSIGVAAVTYAVDRGQTWGWGSTRTIAVAAVGLALLVGFVAIEQRVRWPLVDLSLMRNIPYVTTTASGTATNIAFAVTVFVSALYLQQVQGLSPLAAGAVFLAPSAAFAVAGPLSGWLGAHVRAARIMLAANIVGGVGLLVLSTVADMPLYVVVLGLSGLGLGLGITFSNIATQAAVLPQRAGEASGVLFMVMTTLGGVAVAFASTGLELLESAGRTATSAVELLLRALAVLLLVVAVAAYAWSQASQRKASHLDPAADARE